MTILSPPGPHAAIRAYPTSRATPVAYTAVSKPGSVLEPEIVRSARVASKLVIASIVVLVVLQVVALPLLDPLRGTISGMVHAPGGVLLFAVMGALCATGSVMLAVSLARLGAAKAAVAVGVWSVALAVAAIVPTDPPGVFDVSLAAEIHRDAAAVMFAAMPIAGLLAAAHRFGASPAVRVAQRSLRTAAITSAIIGAMQVLVSIPSLMPDSTMAAWPAVQALFAVRGLAERALFVALLLVLIRIAAVVSLGSTAEPQAARGGHDAALGRSLADQVGVLAMCADVSADETTGRRHGPALGASRFQRRVHQRRAATTPAVLRIDLGMEHHRDPVTQRVVENARRDVAHAELEARLLRQMHHTMSAHTRVNGQHAS